MGEIFRGVSPWFYETIWLRMFSGEYLLLGATYLTPARDSQGSSRDRGPLHPEGGGLGKRPPWTTAIGRATELGSSVGLAGTGLGLILADKIAEGVADRRIVPAREKAVCIGPELDAAGATGTIWLTCG